MSSRSKVPVTFAFHRKGVHPPLFITGSFSNPPWQPLEMDAFIDQHGDYIFTKRAIVDECSEIQYKFRHASGDWWALDPDADTTTDDLGNVNSLLYSPNITAAQEITMLQEIHASKTGDTTAIYNDAESSSSTSSSVVDANARGADTDTKTENLDAPERIIEQDGLQRLSFTPIEEVANTAAEVADSAFQLDEDQLEVGGDILPMFSHECFATLSGYQESEPQHDSFDYSPGNVDLVSMDFDDPRLEHFPSDRDSIMATMRRVSTAIETDSTTVDDVILSPIITAKSSVASNPSSKRSSVATTDTNTEHEQTEDLDQRPASITHKESLESIAEGDESPDGDEMRDLPTPAEYIGPIGQRNLSSSSWAGSNKDEGVAMGATFHQHDNRTNHTKTTDDEAESTTIMDETSTDNAQPTEEHANTVSSSSKSSEQNDEPSLQKPINGERSHSPSSAYSTRDRQKGDWIRTFFRTMFVDWIGDLFCWLCSRSQNQVQRFPRASKTGALIVVGAGISLWALQDRLPSFDVPISLVNERRGS